MSVLLAPASRRRKAELLFRDAGVTPLWSAPPSADEIRALDEERLGAELAGAAPAGEDELARARALLERGGAEAIAVALLRLHRARLPEPERTEDIGEWAPTRERTRPASGPRHDSGSRREEPARLHRREDFGDGVWFRLGVGRKQNADPKWLLPLLCRRGGVTRNEIGAIRIFDRETKVSILAEAAERFAASALGAEKGDVLITRADGSEAPAQVEAKPRAPRYEPRLDRQPVEPREHKPSEKRDYNPLDKAERPAKSKPFGKPGKFERNRPAGPAAAEHGAKKPARFKPNRDHGPRAATEWKARPEGKRVKGK